MLRFSKFSKAGMIAIIALILAFMYIPLFILMLNSFNEAQVSSWPIQSYSLKWWETASELEAIRNALLNSVIVALGAMVVAAMITLRTILADDSCWRLHTSSLGLMILGAIFPHHMLESSAQDALGENGLSDAHLR